MARILIIGGTRFMGYFATEYALARGHEVTLFNRGKSNPAVFSAAEKISGDRDKDIDLLRGRRWDAVIDTCGYVPRVVSKTVEILSQAADYYLFISSVSVYSSFPPGGLDEGGPLATLADPATEEVTGETYGGLKVLCEQVVERAMPGRSALIRAGLIVGPRDMTGRFSYWVHRIAQGGEVLAPGLASAPVQFIDSRDLGEWVIRLAEKKVAGAFNALGPASPITMGDYLTTCVSATGSSASLTWVDESFLLQRNVAPWAELPVWLPESDADMHRTSNARACAAGLTFRPLSDTVSATMDWLGTRPEFASVAGPITRERETALLAEWHATGH